MTPGQKKTSCTKAVTAKRADGPCISRRPQCTQLPAGRSPFLYTPTETQCVPPVLQKKHTLVQEAIAQCFKKASIKKKRPDFLTAQSGVQHCALVRLYRHTDMPADA